MYIKNLVIEVTRKCNMECDHCLRGCSENKDINQADINTLLCQVEDVGSITFTGGEPSLNVSALNYTLAICKSQNISVNSFYIATNGMEIQEDFILACLRWYSYCYEKEMCSVNVSNDLFHASRGNYDTELLGGLSFFSRKHEKENYDYNIYTDSSLIKEGNALEFGLDGRDNLNHDIISVEDLYESEVYLNCNGDIVNGCDHSYKSQNNFILCKVADFEKYYNTLIEERE